MSTVALQQSEAAYTSNNFAQTDSLKSGYSQDIARRNLDKIVKLDFSVFVKQFLVSYQQTCLTLSQKDASSTLVTR